MKEKKTIKATCPHCGKTLNDNGVLVDEKGTIHLIGMTENGRLDIFLSEEWENFNKRTFPEEIKDGEIPEFKCPHCKKPLPTLEGKKCTCDAPIVKINSPQGEILGGIYFCSRNGCKHHLLNPKKIPGELSQPVM